MEVKRIFGLVGGISVGDNIFEVEESISRPDLMNVPGVLQYSLNYNNSTSYFVNSMSQCIVLCKYGDFRSFREMINDWDVSGKEYIKSYT